MDKREKEVINSSRQQVNGMRVRSSDVALCNACRNEDTTTCIHMYYL